MCIYSYLALQTSVKTSHIGSVVCFLRKSRIIRIENLLHFGRICAKHFSCGINYALNIRVAAVVL